ncbi:MAG: hypothetical protein ACYDGO_08930 [Smithellaceae bacterium]
MFGHEVQIEVQGRAYCIYKWPNIPNYLCIEHEVYPDHVLPSCRSDSITMMRLRSVLDSTYQNHLNLMSNDQVIKAVKHMLSSGRAVLVRKRNLQFVHSLRFDGKKLCWINHCGSETKCWPAVSGRPGYQTKEHQITTDYGPLPAGRWLAKQSEYQKISLKDAALGMSSVVGLKSGKWPGSVMAWGAHRVWLHPCAGTNTFKRKDFSIHGGWAAGSAGCIDMTSFISEFVSYFLEYGKDMELIVEYQ